MQPKLIALDLDGTTLNPQAQITSKTKIVLKKAQAAGHLVTIVTGRPYRLSANYYDELKLKTPMINFNGALGHIPHFHWKKEYQKTFPREIISELLDQKQKIGIKVIAAEAKESLLIDQPQNLKSNFFPAQVSEQQILKKSSLKSDPAAVTLLVEKAQETKIAHWLKASFGSYVNVGVWGGDSPIIELEPHGIDKAFGLAYLAKNLGIKRQNILAFGDEHNDQEMIEYAGLGVVMQNGTSALKKAADEITPLDNAHDGLANYLQEKLQLD